MWIVVRSGTNTEVRSATGELVATVGDPKDHRINHKEATAKVIALAPEMLDLLIDVQQLIQREYVIDEHPLASVIIEKTKSIIERSFQKQVRYEKKENHQILRAVPSQVHSDRDFGKEHESVASPDGRERENPEDTTAAGGGNVGW